MDVRRTSSNNGRDPVRRRRRSRACTGAAVVVLATTLGACTPDEPEPAAVPPSSVVVQPGRPGEAATTIAPEDYEAPAPASDWNQADVDFFADMIHHHLQALEMSELAPDRAASADVVALADRIHDVQASEIHGLAAWLQERDLPVPVVVDPGDGSGPRVAGGHDHDVEDMTGMLSDAQMAELAAASGAEFDRLYLTGMIQHHEGAVQMAVDVQVEGVDERANELADDIGAGQQAEIGRMQDLLADL